MYDIRQFKPALYLLVMLGITGFALAAEQPVLWLLTLGAIAINAWMVHSDRFRPMPRFVANVVTVIAFFYVALQVRALGPKAVLVIGQFLVLLQLVKLYEQRANRDYAQLLILSLLLMVAASISTASLAFGVLMMVYLLLSLYCCLLFHLKVESDYARSAIAMPDEELNPATLTRDQNKLSTSMRRLTGFASVISLACAVAIFLFFPRDTGAGLLGPLQFRSSETLTGFSEQVGFEQIARISQSDDLVAHVRLKHNGEPVVGPRVIMLRGVTLDVYYGDGNQGGGAWQWGRAQRSWADSPVEGRPNSWQLVSGRAGDDEWSQVIYLRPTGTNVLFAMAGPTKIRLQRGGSITHSKYDESLRLQEQLQTPLQYEVVSRGNLYAGRMFAPDDKHFQAPFDDAGVPETSVIGERTKAYARLPAVSGSNEQGPLALQRDVNLEVTRFDDAIATAIEKHLQADFAYTLDLTDATRPRREDPLEWFLDDVKRGHCEYFAGAMTLMCQSLGMNARMVVGFKCDEFNDMLGQYVVKQSHAHAWVEVLMPDGMWKTFDPTSARDPRNTLRDTTLVGRLKQFVDFLEYTWAANVVAYDNDTQENLVQNLDRTLTNTAIDSQGFLANFQDTMGKLGDLIATRAIGPVMLLMLLVLVIAVLCFVYEKWRLRRIATRIGLEAMPTHERLRLARQLGFYDDLVQLLEKRQLVRQKHQTPLEWAESLSFLPAEAFESIRRLTEIFYRIRFGKAELSASQRSRLSGVIDRLNACLPTRR